MAIGFIDQYVALQDSIYQEVNIRMLEAIRHLQEVQITKKKPLLERKADRLIYKVENSISTIGSDGYEVMTKAPGVRADEKGLSIIGKSGVEVMVNSHLLNLSGSNLITYLRSLNAEEIKEIEIITNPPAKYEASGNSGLINIVLKKNRSVGFNGSLNTGILAGKFATTGLTKLLNYNENKVHINSNLTGSLGKNYSYVNSQFDRPEYSSEDFFTNTSSRKSFRGSLSLDYDYSKSTSFGLKLEKVNNTVENKNHRQVVYRSADTDSIVNTPGKADVPFQNTSAFIYFQHLIDTAGKKIDMDISYFNYGNQSTIGFNSFTTDQTTAVQRYPTELSMLELKKVNIYAAKLDFTFPTKLVNLDFGAKASYIKTGNSLNYSVSTTLLGTQDSQFNYSERVFALYFSAQKTIQSWSIKLGLRAENTNTETISSQVLGTDSSNYLNLFPTAYVNYKLGKTNSIGLSYGRRINRPDYDYLNPARIYSSAYNYEAGNANLVPSFTTNYEINFNTDNFITAIYATILKNGFSSITVLNPSNSITIKTTQNYLNFHQYGLSESYTFSKPSWLESNNQFNLYVEHDYFSTTYQVPNRKYISAYAATDNTLILNAAKTFRVNFRVFYQFPEVYDFDKRKAYYGLNTSIAMLLLKRKLTVSINGNDILKTGTIHTIGLLNNVKRSFEYYSDNRNFRLAIVYRFGSNNNSKRFKNSSIDEADRIKN
jgi:outer membrane receptor protein involved in Fe transport